MLNHIPTIQELITAIPVIISLIIIEGLLSVDNIMAIAGIAAKLPPLQQGLALRLGIIGAYVFRGLALIFAAWLAAHEWVKLIGSAYLIYLACQHLVEDAIDESSTKPKAVTLFGAICAIEFMDMALSIDNVVAAAAMDSRLWVVMLGVFIGIAILRFLAQLCIKLIDAFPILNSTAFLLVGFVGVILGIEVITSMSHHAVHITSVQKFIGIIVIVITTILFERLQFFHRILTPITIVGREVLFVIGCPLHLFFTCVAYPFKKVGEYLMRFFQLFKVTASV